jgi:hypothetical protein
VKRSGQCPCALPKNGDLCSACYRLWGSEGKLTDLAGVATKGRDVIPHPFKSYPLVLQAKVEGTSRHSLRSLREAKRPEAVVHRNKNDWRFL